MSEPPSPRARHRGYEPADVSVRGVLVAALGGTAVIGVALAALYGLQSLFASLDVARLQPPQGGPGRVAAPPPPKLQADPARALAEHRRREAAILEGYAWVDREAGVARIPIEQAMRLLVERGWPQPATGTRPRPEAVRGLAPWPDWQAGQPRRRPGDASGPRGGGDR